MAPLSSRARTCLPALHAQALPRSARASIHRPFSSAMSSMLPSARTATTRPSSPPVSSVLPSLVAVRMEASGGAATRFCPSGSPISTAPSARATIGAPSTNAAAMTCALASNRRACWVSEEPAWASVMERDQRSSRAGQESVADILLRQIAPNEDDLRFPLLVGSPFALRVAVEHHMHALEDKALGIALHRHNTLGAEDIRAVLLGELIDPGHELGRIDVAIEPHRHRLHVLIVVVLEAMMMVFAVMVMMVVVMVVDNEEIGFDVEDAIEIEGAAFKHICERDVAVLRPMQRRVRVDGSDARFDLAQFGRANKIGLVDDDDVREGDLVLGLGRVAQSLG